MRPSSKKVSAIVMGVRSSPIKPAEQANSSAARLCQWPRTIGIILPFSTLVKIKTSRSRTDCGFLPARGS